MDGLLDVFECIVDSPRHGEYLQEFLHSCTEHQAFYKKKSNAVQPFISFTNFKLNTPSERLEGLLLLKTFLPQCSDTQFADNAISWMHQCVRGIESQASVETNDAAFSVLKILLEMSSSFQELTKNIANSVIAKFVEQLKLTKNKPQVQLTALQCVQVMIRNYGAPCTPHRGVIENFVLKSTDSKDGALTYAASHCFAYLPLIGGAGSQGINHKARWLELQRRTCGTLRQLLDQLLEGVNEVESFGRDESSEKLTLEYLTDMNPVIRIHQITNRFVNVTRFLEAMLLNEFPVTKSVLPDTIISIVCRGLSVNCCTLGNKGSSDVLTVGSVLPRIHIALLRVLRSLIACLGKNLYPQAKLICRLVLQTLKWTATSSRDYATNRPYATLRVEACHTLVAWLTVAKAGSCVETIADELVQALSQDVCSEKAAVKLNVQAGKKIKKRKQNTTAEETASTPLTASANISTRIKLVNPTANDKPCHAALEALYWMVHAAGVLIKPALHKSLQETVLLILFDIQRSAKYDLPVPYSKVECRLSLYKLLQALTLEPHPMWPPPTQFALHILAQGQVDPSTQVSGFCTVALCSVEKLIHSSSQTLQFPISLEEILKGVNIDAASLALNVSAEHPSDEMDAMSITSQHSSVNSGPSCPSFDLTNRDVITTAVDFTVTQTLKDNTITSTTRDEVLSDTSTLVRDLTALSEDNDEVVNDEVIKLTQQTTSTANKGQSSLSTCKDSVDSKEELPEKEVAMKRKCTDDDAQTLSDDSNASGNSSKHGADYQTKAKILNSILPTDTKKLNIVELSDTTETEVTKSEVVLECQTEVLIRNPQNSPKGKLFQGKFSGMTSPKLLGGGEISKVTRFDLPPKFVNLSDDENESVVDLSSDEEFHESNISVVSSNSNYQESILNKSGVTADTDMFEDLEEENDDTELQIHTKIPDISSTFDKTSAIVGISYEESVLETATNRKESLVSTINQVHELFVEQENDEGEGVLVIDLDMPNGKLVPAIGSDEVMVEWEEPSPKRLKRDSDIKDNGLASDNFEGMTDAEVVKTLLDDFKSKLDD